MKRILSIDFDFFQIATAKQFQNYPDGIDRSAEDSITAWNEAYKLHPELANVKANREELMKLKYLLCEQTSKTPVMIANSHKDIYLFIHNYISTKERIKIVNIDTHHDILNDNPSLDCGNWLKFIIDEYDAGFIWVANPQSAQVYGLGEDVGFTSALMPTTLDMIENREFDLIFLCKSNTWVPPHLDLYFTELCDAIEKHFSNVTIEDNVQLPRT